MNRGTKCHMIKCGIDTNGLLYLKDAFIALRISYSTKINLTKATIIVIVTGFTDNTRALRK